MKPTIGLGVVLFLGASFANAQKISTHMSPDALHLGIVHTGARVEASFALIEPGTDAAKRVDVVAPKFVRVTDQSSDTLNQPTPTARTVIELSIDTAVPGEFRGDVEVKSDIGIVKVPISVTILPRRPGSMRVAVAAPPFRAFTANGAAFRTWTDLVKAASLDVDYIQVTRTRPVFADTDLSKFDCIVLSAEGLLMATKEDIERVRNRVKAGARAILAADHFFVGTVPEANKFLEGSALQLNDEEANVAQNRVVIDKSGITADLMNAGIQSVSFHRGSPISLVPSKPGRIIVKAAGVGRAGEGFVATTKLESGELVAIGQSLWWHWITPEQSRDAQNAKLLQWLITKPKE